MIPYGRAIWDFLFVLDGSYRISLGEVPHVDFASPIGALTLYFTYWCERLFPATNPFVGLHVVAWLATLLAPGRSPVPGWIVGVLFLAGGIANVMMLPAPYWFSAVDLIFAYLPMAWLALKVAGARETPGTIAPAR